ncbi:MAG TPA: prepilin-type N-terminal cleavage/methylation domain-containing protein [Tepidisphaeraceae bacterium]|jgi:Tfp pilus assembly protein PilW
MRLKSAGERRRRRHGLGLVELLVALSISAAVLTATAVATDAAFRAYHINREQSDLMQRARLSVYRITTMLRQTKLHAPHTPTLAAQFATGKTVTDTAIDMYDMSNNQVSYRFDVTKKQLLAVVNGTSHVMCSGVETFSVNLEPMRSADSIKTGGAWDLLRRATILLTVRTTASDADVGAQSVTLSASVMPRRNTW